jgi:hypothetical protein
MNPGNDGSPRAVAAGVLVAAKRSLLPTNLVGEHQDAAAQERQGPRHRVGIDLRNRAAGGGGAARLSVSETRAGRQNQGQARQLHRFDPEVVDERNHDA